MKILGRSSAWGLLIAVALAGCAKTPAHPPDTGARKAVLSYYEGLLRRDWEIAYSALDAGSKARCTQEQFSRWAQNYRSSLGFEPEAVHVRACDERDGEATAHVILTGRAGAKDRRYKDAITLQRGDDGWHVILPQTAGIPRGACRDLEGSYVEACKRGRIL